MMKNNNDQKYKKIATLLSKSLEVDLHKKQRSIEYSWTRFACYKYLNDKEIRCNVIAGIFDVTHSAVIHGVNQMNDKLGYGDKYAVNLWVRVKETFENNKELKDMLSRMPGKCFKAIF